MPDYRVIDIKIKSGVIKDDNGLFQAFSDQPIDMSYDDNKSTNTFGGSLSNSEIFENVKWVFKQNGEILSLIDGDYVDSNGNIYVFLHFRC